ncbi:expressed unknown protein [Seminavis robusta]|uniref:SGNH hydrolase-type esterase domain-containing protein n=1 Tax=Seminavis robusta TaxID=568900 RepID=A0A9N8HC48_9STRA|nr:expressed unknown protein [Seminavis robusta]|eukprot:Sro286_g108310.1 n/a (563) ;mRNA; r:37356-39044
MPYRSANAFREQVFRYAVRSAVGITVASPFVAIFQASLLLEEFRRNHRDAPFPEMPCSGAVVAVTPGRPASFSSAWVKSLLLSDDDSTKNPEPLRLLIVGDSLAAGVGVTKSGTPVLPEAIAKTLSSALGGRAVYWTCMGEPGLSSPQIVKELLLAEEEEEEETNEISEEEKINVMEELRGWWDKRLQLQQQEEREEQQQRRQQAEGERQGPGKRVRAWWDKTRSVARRDLEDLGNIGRSIRRRMTIARRIPEPAVVLPQRRNAVVPDLVAQYDVAVVITGFNDLKYLIFPLPEDPDAAKEEDKQPSAGEGAWFERDLWGIMRALQGKMRNYGEEEEDDPKPPDSSDAKASVNNGEPESNQNSGNDDNTRRRHHPIVVFPAAPMFNEPIYPLSFFAEPMIRLMEYQKKKLAERYPAPVLFLEAPNDETIKDFTNKRGPLWEASSREEVLFELTNKARLEQLEKLMKEYYDMWTVDVEEEEATYTYDAFGPDIQGPLQHLHRSPLISVDRVHPNDEGYELWGRHIAQAIVEEWDRKDNWKDQPQQPTRDRVDDLAKHLESQQP